MANVLSWAVLILLRNIGSPGLWFVLICRTRRDDNGLSTFRDLFFFLALCCVEVASATKEPLSWLLSAGASTAALRRQRPSFSHRCLIVGRWLSLTSGSIATMRQVGGNWQIFMRAAVGLVYPLLD
ncbi:hypothetical protein B0J12DRAFT_87371 [Macrophomina phaseolina]|uniref:Secreted protein n=1 Tax=Macrophomina phaseolina TaxID=35725 RepID=A0ABQ8GAH9_9PEZI|nr:hypothetical protein B0J12DRAFT_87371 [Macrophomina phaseolina]